jgi:hypothetical protein
VSIAVVLAMLPAPDILISFGSRLAMAGVTFLAVAVIGSRRMRDANLLISPLDYGWLSYVLLTGLSVLFAASPRRSVESWLWLTAIHLPIAYGALYLFRRHWHERAVYRALLVGVGYLYLLALSATLNYAAEWLAARADGIAGPDFACLGSLTTRMCLR